MENNYVAFRRYAAFIRIAVDFSLYICFKTPRKVPSQRRYGSSIYFVRIVLRQPFFLSIDFYSHFWSFASYYLLFLSFVFFIYVYLCVYFLIIILRQSSVVEPLRSRTRKYTGYENSIRA